jgi:ribose 5-phosphate isomerase B
MIAIGADHGGYKLKEEIKKYLIEKNQKFKDFGTFSEESIDYPDIAIRLAEEVRDRKCELGIVICKTGFGMSIATNKVKGIRCAVCSDTYEAQLAKEHNNVNVLGIGASRMSITRAISIIEVWMSSQFLGGRHQQRIDKISKYENNK